MKIASIVAALALLLGSVAPSTAFEFDTVMVNGRPDGDPLGPELGPAIDWEFAAFAVINDAGQVGLQGQLLQQGGVTSSTDVGIWRWQNGSKQLLAREGEQADAFPAGAIDSSFPGTLAIQIDEAGTILFRNSLAGTANSGNNIAWTTISADGTATAVARESEPAPGLGPVTYGSSIFVRADGPGLSNNGNVLFLSRLSGPGVTSENDNALWFGPTDNPSLLVREGGPATDFSPTAVFGLFPLDGAYAAGNRVAFVASVNDGDDTGSLLLSGTPGSLSVIAKTGDAAPGTGQTFFTFRDTKLNGAGVLSFTGVFETTVDRGLYLANGTSLSLVAADGMSAAGTSEAFTPPGSGSTIPFPSTLTESGDLAFYSALAASASVDATNDTGIWVHDDGTTRLAIREGTAAAGISGATIGEIRHWAFNDQEDLVFVSELLGNVTPDVDDLALWQVDSEGNLTKLLQAGESFDVDPSTNADLRTIASINLEGLQETSSFDGLSRYQTLSDSRRLLFGLDFTDGTSGVFTAQIPEPSSLALFALATLDTATGRRRWRVL